MSDLVSSQAPGESGCSFPKWNTLPLLSPISFDATFYRISCPIPQGSHILRAEVIFQSEISQTIPSLGFKQQIPPGGDGKLVIRTQLVDNDNVYWPLWSGPIHGLPFLSTYSDSEVQTMRGIDDVAVDVTAALQAFVNRPTWNPAGKALFRFSRADWSDPDVFYVSRGMCYNYWQCAPQLRFSYRPPGQKKRQLVPPPPPQHAKRVLPLPAVSIVTPPWLLLGVAYPVSFSASAAAVTSYVAISVDGGANYEIACARVDFPQSVCLYTRNATVTTEGALLRVIAYNAEGGPAVAVSSPFAIRNPPPSVAGNVATVVQGQQVAVPVSIVLGLAASSAAVTITVPPSFGAAAWDAAASAIVFRGDATHNGPVAVGFQVCDNLRACSVGTASVTVTPVPPSLVSDAATTLQGVSVAVAVLANDGGLVLPLSLSGIAQQPTRGTASIVGAAVVYQPQATFFGADSFVYTACDASVPPSCGTATATVTVTAVPPRAVADAATTPQGQAATVAVLANDVLGPAPLASVAVVSAPTHGTVAVVSGNSLRYTPSSACWNGADSFSYRITDASGQSSAPAVVSLQQTAATLTPVARGDSYVLGIGAAALPVTANDDLAAACAPVALAIANAPAKGTAMVVASESTISYTSTVAANAWLTYRLCDSSAPTQLCSSGANVTLKTLSSRITFVTPSAGASWAAGAWQNVSFTQTLGLGSLYVLSFPAAARTSVLPGTATATQNVWQLLRMPPAPVAASLVAYPAGQPTLQKTVSFAVVSASITSVSSPSSLRVRATATVSWRHNVGLFETGFSVRVVCTGSASSLQIASGLASSVTSAVWTVEGTRNALCHYSVIWQNTTGNGTSFKLQ